jgi:hypothetical protein
MVALAVAAVQAAAAAVAAVPVFLVTVDKAWSTRHAAAVAVAAQQAQAGPVVMSMVACRFLGRVARRQACLTRQAQRFDFAVIFAAQAVDKDQEQAGPQVMQAGLMGVDQAAVRAQPAQLMVAQVDHAPPVHFSPQQAAAVAQDDKRAQTVGRAAVVDRQPIAQQARAVAAVVAGAVAIN